MAVAVDIAGFAGVSFSVLTASVEEGTGGAGAAVAGAAGGGFFAGFGRVSSVLSLHSDAYVEQ